MLKELVREGVDRRPPMKWPTYDGKNLDRSKFVTASEAEGCERKIWYSKHYPRDKLERWGFAERGHSSEAWVVEQLRNAGNIGLMMVGDQQVSLYNGVLSGTPDGFRAMDDGTHRLLEFKGVDPRTNFSNLPKEGHITQVQINMDLARTCLNWDVQKAHILYTDAADYEHMLEFVIDYDPLVADKHYARAEVILNAEHADELEPEGVYNGGCKLCDFASKCSGAVQAARKEREANKDSFDAAKQFFK